MSGHNLDGAAHHVVDGALDLLPRALAVLEQVEWEGDPEGSYDFQDRAVTCPCCGKDVDCETGLEAKEDGDWDDDDDDDPVDLVAESVKINTYACPEGWAIFNIEDDPAIQRDDDMKIFESDADAELHVETLARGGSHLHVRALEVVTLQTAKLDRDHEEAWKHNEGCELRAVLDRALELGIKSEAAD